MHSRFQIRAAKNLEWRASVNRLEIAKEETHDCTKRPVKPWKSTSMRMVLSNVSLGTLVQQ